MPNSRGFTLIELLIVVSLVGILSGIVISVINPTLLNNRAKDGVRLGNVAKVAQAFEAYYAAEGSYPATQAALQTTSGYIKSWPDDDSDSSNGSNYIYNYITDANTTVACASVPMATSAKYFKYNTSYDATMGGTLTSGQVIGKVVKNCDSSCSSKSLTGCTVL